MVVRIVAAPDAPAGTPQPPVPQPNPKSQQYIEPTRPANSNKSREQATLVVQGLEYQDWESVWVQLRWGDAFSYFRFAAVERDTPRGLFYVIQFVPGESCQINLGGVDVINGFIETRQVAYDSVRHGVELQGKSATAPVARSSVNTKSGSFDGMTFQEVAQKVLSEYPVGIKVIGSLNSIPFDKLQNQPGEQIWDFLERIARPRGIILGSDSFGNFLLIGDHEMPVLNTQLIEGQNIKKCQCVMHKDETYVEYRVTAQSAASDDNWGTKASQLEASWGGTGYLKSLLITPSEQPVKSIQEVLDRAKNEALWHEGPQIDLNVTVQGWFRDGENLWWPGDNVFVYSPMCPLNQIMKIQNVTFTQDNTGGTETLIEMVQPWALKDLVNVNAGVPNAPQAPQQTPPGQQLPPTP
jgi:prophage tail gpP-like protein